MFRMRLAALKAVAAGGALTGAAASDKKGKGAVIGGAIGALGGAAIGNALYIRTRKAMYCIEVKK